MATTLTPLAIVIVNYRSWKPLEACLSSLESLPDGVSVIVVDNDSADGCLEDFRRAHPRVTFVIHSGNPGFASACNRGAQQSDARVLLFLNPDTQASPSDIEKMTVALESRGGRGVLTVPQHDSRGCRQKVYGAFPSLVGAFGWSRALSRLVLRPKASHLQNGECAKVDWVTGAALMIDQSSFQSLGGFDDDFWMYYEDVDLCRRARRADIPVRVCAVADILHEHGGATRKDADTTLITKTEVVVSRHLYIRKHHRGVQRLLLQTATVIGRLLAPLPLCILSARRRRRTAALWRYYRRAAKLQRWKTCPHGPEHQPS